MFNGKKLNTLNGSLYIIFQIILTYFFSSTTINDTTKFQDIHVTLYQWYVYLRWIIDKLISKIRINPEGEFRVPNIKIYDV